MRKRVGGCAALVLVMALVAACGGGKAQTGKSVSQTGSSRPYPELRWGVSAFGSKLELRKELSVAISSIEGLAVQGLEAFEPDGKLKPELASSTEQPNPTTYVYHLKAGVKFSDGKPLTVADVIYSLKLDLGSESAVKGYWENVSSVSAQGSSAVVVKLKRPNALWPEYLALTDQIVEQEAAEEAGGEKTLGTENNLPVSTGPWKIDSFTPEVGVKLSRNPYWSGPRQGADKIDVSVFKTEASEALALRSDAIDGASFYSAPKLFLNIPGVRELTAPGVSLEFLEMNTTAKPFDNVYVRRAIGYAANVKGMLRAMFPPGFATEETTFASRESFANLGSPAEVNAMLDSLPKYEFDLTAAKRELAKSPYPHGFSTTLQVAAGSPVELGLGEILASDLAKVGITVKIHEFTASEYPDLFAGKYAIWLQGYASNYPDPESMFSLLLSPSQIDPPGSGLNGSRYRNDEVAKLLIEQREKLNPAQRLQVIGRLLKVAGKDEPYAILFTPAESIALSDRYVFPTFSPWTNLYGPFAAGVRLAK
jgi:peptide/nickel transport system substrate-binding protein